MAFPPLKRWAIFGCPCRDKDRSDRQTSEVFGDFGSLWRWSRSYAGSRTSAPTGPDSKAQGAALGNRKPNFPQGPTGRHSTSQTGDGPLGLNRLRRPCVPRAAALGYRVKPLRGENPRGFCVQWRLHSFGSLAGEFPRATRLRVHPVVDEESPPVATGGLGHATAISTRRFRTASRDRSSIDSSTTYPDWA